MPHDKCRYEQPEPLPDDSRIIPDYVAAAAAQSRGPAEDNWNAAQAILSRAIHAVHATHEAYLTKACELTDADCVALRAVHHDWVTAEAAVEAARAALPDADHDRGDRSDIPF